MAKLSAQLQQKSDTATTIGKQIRGSASRPTRTQRVIAKAQFIKETRKAQADFNKLKEEADTIREQKFKQLPSIASYREEYAKLRDDLKPFFIEPTALEQQVEQEKQEKIATNIPRADAEIKKWEDRQRQEDEFFDRKRNEQREKLSPEAYDRWRQKITNKIKEFQAKAQFWKKAKGEFIQQGVDFKAVEDWVEANVDFEVAKREAKQSAIEKAETVRDKLFSTSFAPVYKKFEEQHGKVFWTEDLAKSLRRANFIDEFGLQNFKETQDLKQVTIKEIPAKKVGLQPSKLIVYQGKGGEKFQEIREPTGNFTFKEVKKNGLSLTGKVIEAPTIPSTVAGRQPLVLQTREQAPKTTRFVETREVPKTFFGRLGNKILTEYFGVIPDKQVGIRNIPQKILSVDKAGVEDIVQATKEDVEIGKQEVKANLEEYKLFYNPDTQEMLYLPKGELEANTKIIADRSLKPVEKLTINTATGELTAIKRDQQAVEGSIVISPTSFERLYQGKTQDQFLKSVQDKFEKAPIWKKPFYHIYPLTTPSSKLGFRQLSVTGAYQLGLISKKEWQEEIDDSYKDAFTKDFFEKTGEKPKPLITLRQAKVLGIKAPLPQGFLPESPPAQASAVLGTAYVGGAVVGGLTKLAPASVKALAVAHPIAIKTVTTGTALGLTSYYGVKTGLDAKKLIVDEGASKWEALGLVGERTVKLGVGVTGFKAGLKYGLPVKFGSVKQTIATGTPEQTQQVFSSQEFKHAGIIDRFNIRLNQGIANTKLYGKPLLKGVTLQKTLWRGIYFDGKEPTVLFGKTFYPTYAPKGTVSGFVGKTQFGFPKDFAFIKTALVKDGFVPAGRLETLFAKKYASSLPKVEQDLMNSALFFRRTTEHINPPFKSFNKFKDVETISKHLTPKQQQDVWKYFQKQKGNYMVYGSSTVKGYMGDQFPRKLHDVDATFFNAKSGDKAKELFGVLKRSGSKAGVKISLQGADKNQIMVSVKGKVAEKLFDIHGSDSPEITSRDIWGFEFQDPQVFDKPPITDRIGFETVKSIKTGSSRINLVKPFLKTGIRTMTLSQSATQKLGGTLTFQQDPSGNIVFAPESFASPKFQSNLKHITDLYAISKFQSQSLTGIDKTRTLSALNTFKKSAILKFPELKGEFDATKILGIKSTPLPKTLPKLDGSTIAFSSTTPANDLRIRLLMRNQVGSSVTKENQLLKRVLNKVSSPSVSITPSRFISPSVSFSPTASLVTSPSISFSPSMSLSPSVSVSQSPSQSPSVSVSPSVSASPSFSVSPSPSISLGLSPSVSPSTSPSTSPSPSVSLAPTPVPAPPTTIILPFIPRLPKAKKRNEKDIIKQATFSRAFLPDFTSRALGLEAPVVSGADATKLVNKILTGLEVRTGARIRRGVRRRRN